MRTYYDSEARVMIAVDPATEDVRILEAINFDDDEPLKPVKVKPFAKVEKQPGQGCPECGSKSRHRKGCSRAGGASKERMDGNDACKALDEKQARAGRATLHQYSQIRIAHGHKIDPETIATEIGLSLAEVNTAILSSNFEEYSN
jgi:hypothetical protein